jgi:chromosome segregation ATPase
MEFGLRDLLTILTVVAGGLATVKVLEAKLARVILDITEIQKTIKHLFEKIDAVEEGRAVMESQITTFKSILSPDNLAAQNREAADLAARLRVQEEKCNRLAVMHNGDHKPTGVRS